MEKTQEHIVLVDKPKGITSFDVIRILRKKLGVQKLGHAGTLDPLASGLMIIGVGEGTKKLKEYVGLPKEYVADVLLGEQRATGDMEGKILEEINVPEIDTELVKEELQGMVGILRLPVSAYSAMKRGGVPMYKRARKAEKTSGSVGVLPIRDMEVMKAELLQVESIAVNRDTPGYRDGGSVGAPDSAVPTEAGRVLLRVRFYVGSGTYIRSLAEELGRRLGYPATLRDLRRTRIGDFDIEHAEMLEK